jgi:hypothetical protein
MWEDSMQVHYVGSKFAIRDESEAHLKCWMAVLGLDFDAIERDYTETFDKIKRECVSCRVRVPCALDLKRDPNNLVWEAYCPNAGVLNALVALTELIH